VWVFYRTLDLFSPMPRDPQRYVRLNLQAYKHRRRTTGKKWYSHPIPYYSNQER
jgi:hypothetical protein